MNNTPDEGRNYPLDRDRYPFKNKIWLDVHKSLIANDLPAMTPQDLAHLLAALDGFLYAPIPAFEDPHPSPLQALHEIEEKARIVGIDIEEHKPRTEPGA